jgi:sugar phosphate isomerase/epimerase
MQLLRPPGIAPGPWPPRTPGASRPRRSEVDWPAFFSTLDRIGFGSIMTACVFAWEDRAHDSCRFMRAEIDRYVSVWKPRD